MAKQTALWTGRVRFSALVLFLAVLGGSAMLGTAAVSAALPGRTGAPAVTTPTIDRSASAQPLIRLAVVGDVGTGEDDELAVAARMAAVGVTDPFDGLILLGDNVYPDGDPGRLDETVFGPFGRVLNGGAALLPVLGNHDSGFAAEQIAVLGMPGRWYSREVGGVLYLGLDSTDAENPAQLAWLEASLAEASADWVIVGMHHPPFSAGVHGSDEDARDAFVPLFERYGVDLVLAGHDHDYQRSVPIGGVTYIVSGAGAKVRQTGAADFTASSAAVLHFVEVAVWRDRLVMNAISLDGTFDSIVIDGKTQNGVTAANFPIGGFFSDDETGAGARLAVFGFSVWLLVMATGWFLPGAASGRVGRAYGTISAASTLTVIAGVFSITISVVG